jgi:hypothetical protein
MRNPLLVQLDLKNKGLARMPRWIVPGVLVPSIGMTAQITHIEA